MVFPENLSEVSPFARSLVKKQLKKHDVPCKETVTSCKTCRFFCGLFFLILCLKYLTFCLLSFFFVKTQLKKHNISCKNHYVLWKSYLFWSWFFQKLCEISPFALFLDKHNWTNTMHLEKNPLRFVKLVAFLMVVFPEIQSELSLFALF